MCIYHISFIASEGQNVNDCHDKVMWPMVVQPNVMQLPRGHFITPLVV